MRRKEGVVFSEKLDAFFRERYAVFIAQGEAEGEAKGKAEGKAEGKVEGKVEVARNLKNMGLSVSQIQQATGLSSAAIKRLG